MSRTYDYVFSDSQHSHITVTTSDEETNVEISPGVFAAGYAIESISGTFDGAEITGLYGSGGDLQASVGVGLFDNTIFISDSQGDHGSKFGIDGAGIVFTTTSGIYGISSDGSDLFFSHGRDGGGPLPLQSWETPPPDTAPPVLVFSTPFDDMTNVAADSNIDLSFNELIKLGAGTITISNGDGDTRVIDVTDASQVQVSGSTLSINPTADLHAGTTYHVTISAGAVTDIVGNGFAGLPSGALDFSTASVVTGNDPVLNGTSGDDSVIGTNTESMQTLNGLDGNDTLTLAAGGGFANGGAGDDNLVGGDSANGPHFTGNMLDDFDGDNVFSGGNAGSLATVQNLIAAGQGNDMAYGGNASGQGAFVYNLMQMGEGANHAWGGNASGGATLQNFIFGGSGDDTFVAGSAADDASHVYNLLTGNGGSDHFVLKPGSNQTTITDFTAGAGAGHDVIDLSAYAVANIESVLAAATESGGATILHLTSDHGTADDVMLTGVAKSDLVAGDFLI
jgi:methionine-rich copper-binding protein CopC